MGDNLFSPQNRSARKGSPQNIQTEQMNRAKNSSTQVGCRNIILKEKRSIVALDSSRKKVVNSSKAWKGENKNEETRNAYEGINQKNQEQHPIEINANNQKEPAQQGKQIKKVGSPNVEKAARLAILNSETQVNQQLSQSFKPKASNQLLDSLNQIVGDEALVFKLCFNQNRVEEHMKQRRRQGSLDSFIAKSVSNKEGLKEKALRKRELFMNSRQASEAFKKQLERKNQKIDKRQSVKEIIHSNRTGTIGSSQESLNLPPITLRKCSVQGKNQNQMDAQIKTSGGLGQMSTLESDQQNEQYMKNFRLYQNKNLSQLYKKIYQQMADEGEKNQEQTVEEEEVGLARGREVSVEELYPCFNDERLKLLTLSKSSARRKPESDMNSIFVTRVEEGSFLPTQKSLFLKQQTSVNKKAQLLSVEIL